MVLRTCQQVEGGLPASVKSKMVFNIIVDFAIGLVPFIGDVADALFRANTKNAVLLEEHLRQKGVKTLKQQGRPVPTVDPSDPDEFDRIENSPPPAYTTAPPSTHGTQRQDNAASPSTVTQAQPKTQAQAPTAPAAERGGFFGFGKKKKQPDVELGNGESRREEAQPVLSNNPAGSAKVQKTTR